MSKNEEVGFASALRAGVEPEVNWQARAEEYERQLHAQGELLRRTKEELAAAAQVCVLFGWTAAAGTSDKDKAVEQAWQDWADAYGSISPTPVWRERIKELARRRDEIRAQTLAKIRSARSAEERSDEAPNASDLGSVETQKGNTE